MDRQRVPQTIGIVSSTEDIADILQDFLHGAGYATRVASVADFKRGRQDASAWLAGLAPTAILYDIAPPYEENWYFCRWVRALPVAAPQHFIITTPNDRLLERVAGVIDAVEFVGEPFDLGEILDRIELALAAIGRDAMAPMRCAPEKGSLSWPLTPSTRPF